MIAYLVLKCLRWGEMKLEAAPGSFFPYPYPINLKDPKNGNIGFAPLYDNEADALEMAGGNKDLVLPVQVKD